MTFSVFTLDVNKQTCSTEKLIRKILHFKEKFIQKQI